ncbi:hypothetical protein FDT66_08855 [Polaribacter aestuariivivens]|uniref:Lipoprotein n=1 Tax=Polaribacter aestuariivivens TaxID=2304626 RepID=A0A5S3NAQ1_9FLAO|nr:hypothetical protein [Polaribacter aestuariivivens]TMM29966.1 hypothetical protein FDT66_08855 [Polaribacter aestuariivivens]
MKYLKKVSLFLLFFVVFSCTPEIDEEKYENPRVLPGVSKVIKGIDKYNKIVLKPFYFKGLIF